MLQTVCEYIHNYFISKDGRMPRCWANDYSIVDGVISPAVPLKEGQRFLIRGSDLNDGVYTYHESGITNDDDAEVAGLQAEDFTGSIAAMAVPPAVIALSDEISAWIEKYGDAMNSPYQSESFGGYSYNKGSGGSGGSAIGSADWRSVFGSRLNRWRKINDEFIVPRKQNVLRAEDS